MSAAVRDVGVAINWRVTLLGLNLAAWLVGALVIAALFVHHEIEHPPLYPGFGDSVQMFNDIPVFYPARVDTQPVVGLQGIGKLKPTAAEPAALNARQDRGLTRSALGPPRPLGRPDTPAKSR